MAGVRKTHGFLDMLPWLLACLTLLEPFAAGLGPLPKSPAGSGRVADSEPNDDPVHAVEIISDEVVEGSLLMTPSGDSRDWYKIEVPYGKVINASLYLVDYDVIDPGKVNFQLSLCFGDYTPLDNSTTANRWESVLGIQFWSPSAPQMIYIGVTVNITSGGKTSTDPGNYTLSASIRDPLDYTSGQANGNLNVNGPCNRALYKMQTGPAQYQAMKAKLVCPPAAIFHLYIYNLWMADNWWLRNASYKHVAGQVQEAVFNGCGGAYYALLKGEDGNGTFTLTIEDNGKSIDDNNIPAEAVLVRDLYPHTGFADQGADGVDWWKVELKAGRALTEAYFSIVAGAIESGSSFNFYVYDKNLSALPAGVSTGMSYILLSNIVIDYDGPVYFAVVATKCVAPEESGFIPCRGWYKVTFTIPNDPPVCQGGIPEVDMLEDTVDSSLNLSAFFNDSENDTISYRLVPGVNHTRPKVSATSGMVTFTPEKDWNGREIVRFRATDDGPGNKWVEVNVTVIVEPVNDPPVLNGTLEDLIIDEDVEGRTADIRELFSDVDDPVDSLIFSIRVISQDTHPPEGNLTLSYDRSRHIFRLGPAIFLFGTFTLMVNCTDGHPGTKPAETKFNLTVTHTNHDPVKKDGVADPFVIEITEHSNNSETCLEDLFTDPDLPRNYANDTLKYTISGKRQILANITNDGRLFLDTGTVEYLPGKPYEEMLLLTARDRFGRSAALNISVRVRPVDDPPYIVDFQPSNHSLRMSEGGSQTFRVAAADNDTAELLYTWFLDGVLDRPRGTPTYTYLPDFTMGGVVHILRAVVSDGTSNTSREWTVDVIDVNRLPSVSIRSPANLTKVKAGTAVLFQADASDPDGDELSFIWMDENGTVIGSNASFSTFGLAPGTRKIKLEVNDTKDSVLLEVVVIITSEKPPGAKGFLPGSGGLEAALAVLTGLFLIAVRKAKRI